MLTHVGGAHSFYYVISLLLTFWFLQFFCIMYRASMTFLYLFVGAKILIEMIEINIFSSIEPHLHSWKKHNLVVIHYLLLYIPRSDLLFRLGFCIHVHEWDWRAVFLFCIVFVRFWYYQGYTSLTKWVVEWFLCSLGFCVKFKWSVCWLFGRYHL